MIVTTNHIYCLRRNSSNKEESQNTENAFVRIVLLS